MGCLQASITGLPRSSTLILDGTAEERRTMDEIPAWFWQVLDSSKPRLSTLEAWLAAQPRRTVEQFAAAYTNAAETLGDYSAGVDVDEEVWSEDSTEDLYNWIVSQGHDYWAAVVSGEHPLVDVVDLYLDRPSSLGAAPVRWTNDVSNPEHQGYQAPCCIAHGVYRTRFGEEIPDHIDTPHTFE
jgi:hypothetical protein